MERETVVEHCELAHYPEEWLNYPALHLLRVSLRDRWVRFHTLPEGRVLDPSSDDEVQLMYRNVLRAWELVTSTVGSDGWVALGINDAQSMCKDPNEVKHTEFWEQWFIDAAQRWRTVTVDDSPRTEEELAEVKADLVAQGVFSESEINDYTGYPPVIIDMWQAPFPNTPETFKEFAVKNARHERELNSLVHIESRTLFHVYHSGVDVIAATSARRDAFEAELLDLKPTFPSG